MKISDLVQNLPFFLKELNMSINFDEESFKKSQPYLSYTILMEKISSLFSSFHSHDEHYETLYILEGECQYKVDDKTYNIKKGDMAITFPNQMHQIISTTPSKTPMALRKRKSCLPLSSVTKASSSSPRTLDRLRFSTLVLSTKACSMRMALTTFREKSKSPASQRQRRLKASLPTWLNSTDSPRRSI